MNGFPVEFFVVVSDPDPTFRSMADTMTWALVARANGEEVQICWGNQRFRKETPADEREKSCVRAAFFALAEGLEKTEDHGWDE